MVPAYAEALPAASVVTREERILETVRFVVDALVEVIAVVEAFVIVVTPVNDRLVVVELFGNGYPKFA